MSCDVGEATGRFENDQSSFSKLSVTSPTSQRILQCYLRFTYITAHSPSFVTSPMSQLILQPFLRFTYVTAHYPTLLLLHLHHSPFSNPSFASPMSQDFHLRHLVSCPCAIPRRQTINAAYYCMFLQHHLRLVLRSKQLHLVVQNLIILHDNAKSHTAASVMDLLLCWQWEILEHAPVLI